ncbi:MAG: hypothetical protein JWM69_421, partial [Candidatus Binatus sp.]|nr:hypothetical protein [Candidatus Binatus sp.]
LGCAPSALGSARRQINAGNFPAARRELIALANNPRLTASERREVKDDLCLSDFMIGRPATTLAEQRRVCADAAKEPGSQSGAMVARLNRQVLDADSVLVDRSLSSHDLAGAERAALDYQNTPGADPERIAKWSSQIWTLADAQVFVDPNMKKASLVETISQARKDYPAVRHMDESQFRRWVEKTLTVGAVPIVSNVAMSNSRLTLSLSDTNLHLAALNLDKLSTVNNAMAARCGCNAETDVAMVETGFPAYIVRLDPETRLSEVMILPRADHPILSASAD